MATGTDGDYCNVTTDGDYCNVTTDGDREETIAMRHSMATGRLGMRPLQHKQKGAIHANQ